ncbi:ABC transporter permease [Sutcliffiella horikoshii]|uniref:hypothetical protein n=1 Tax=Sutcliffiella horikoshii TaxID=79883 RepID=UPI00384BC55A
MWAICLNEFKGHFKSFKSIVVIAIIFGVTYLTADLMSNLMASFPEEAAELGTDGYATGIVILIFVLGFFFITGLSHDIVNREVSERTMRFLVTKTTRLNVMMGKYLGVWFFWLFCMVVCFLLITIKSKDFLWLGLVDTMLFLSVALALNLVFSIVIPKPGVTMFVGITFALVFPALSFWAIFSGKLYITWFKFFTPYYYSSLADYYILINGLYAFLLLLLAYWLFKRRDF